ncbi:TIGR02300 family protein [Candidatus Puniceispirillum sp.]|nr:TIGR02300 family protein [Candidatus Puniceispirillum sp.]
MAKVELGVKRICLSCGMRFYDFNRSPIACPGCGTDFDFENFAKSKKSREVKKSKTKKVLSDTEAVTINDGGGDEKTSVDDEEVDFDEEGADDTDESLIITDDLGDEDPLVPNSDKKEEE